MGWWLVRIDLLEFKMKKLFKISLSVLVLLFMLAVALLNVLPIDLAEEQMRDIQASIVGVFISSLLFTVYVYYMAALKFEKEITIPDGKGR